MFKGTSKLLCCGICNINSNPPPSPQNVYTNSLPGDAKYHLGEEILTVEMEED